MTLSALCRAYQPPTDLLRDRVILVTGAGSGIGQAAARAYAEHGATVVLAGRTVTGLERVYDNLLTEGLPEPIILPLDLNTEDPAVYQQVHDGLVRDVGRLDGVLHNAGILGDKCPIDDYTPAVWRQVLQVNLTAPFLLTRALLPLLRQAPDAALLFTSSGVGRRGRAYWGAYAVSKFGTEGLMQVLADELDQTSAIRVNAINPGPTRTAMRHAAYPAEPPDTHPAPEALMPLYLYLMGPDSREVHGRSLDAQER